MQQIRLYSYRLVQHDISKSCMRINNAGTFDLRIAEWYA